MATYYLVGTFNNWTASSAYALTLKAGTVNTYEKKGISLTQGTALKVVSSDNVWYSNASTWEDCGFTLDNVNNIVLNESAEYNIEFYGEAQNNNHVYLNKVEPLPEVDLEDSSFYDIKVEDNDDYYTFTVGGVSFDIGKAS